MGLIVHLTDLHLGPKGAATPSDDMKVAVVPDEERTTRRDDAEAALKSLSAAIRENRKTISALVISGDITTASSREGFADLKAFLGHSFGDLLPPPGRIVAIPGNHDVAWFESDAAKRYEAFKQYCIDEGYVTPPLEGVNLTGDARRWASGDSHVLIDIDEQWAILPINSTAFSGVRAALTDETGAKLANDNVLDLIAAGLAGNPLQTAVFKQLRKAREYDMARVSKKQITAFDKSADYVATRFDLGAKPLLLATLHHQLSPVDEREEIKPFESLSNLGRVRAMLKDAEVSVIFHGHKHQSRVFWDSREDASADGRTRKRHDMLVVSGGTIGGGGPREHIANVVEITPLRRGHDVRIWSLGDYVDDAATTAKTAMFFDRRRLSPADVGAGLIEAQDFDEAYARLEREAPIIGQGRINDLVVRIADGSSAAKPPAHYPSDAAGSGGLEGVELGEWFREVALWWQSPLIEAPEGLFTHGRRLRLHDGKTQADQIAAIIEILKRERRDTNGRAIATLIDPETDILAPNAGAPTSFPAFCVVQLHIGKGGPKDRLDATAYFRKQEMRYWWPVNVAEIFEIMTRAVQGIPGMELGSITTISAIAVWQPSRSRVAIPKIDRLYLQDHRGRTLLSTMAALLSSAPAAATSSSDRGRARRAWREVLDDLVPSPDSARDNIPVAVDGVAFLQRSVEAQLAAASAETIKRNLRKAAAALKTLKEEGEKLRELSKDTKVDGWQGELVTRIAVMAAARNELTQLIAAACRSAPGRKAAATSTKKARKT